MSLVRGRYQYAMDSAAWAIAFLVTVLLRYNFDISQVRWFSLLVVCFVAAVLQLLASWRHPLCQAGVRHPGFCGVAFERAGNGRNHVGRIRAASPEC